MATATPQTVIVIEDLIQRVDWLRDHVPEGTEIVHVETVHDFGRALEANPDPALLIFDHDLSWDADGTGADAAKLVPQECPIPCLVWSGSPPGARRIMDILQRDKHCPSALYIPFFNIKPTVVTALLAS